MHAQATAPISNSGEAALKDALVAIVGPDNVRDDAASLALHSEDIWAKGKCTVALIVMPDTIEQLSEIAAAAHAAGFALAPRGGGMSYTSAYLPVTDRTVSIDMSAMDRVLSVSPEDMTVTVEAGCTWVALNEAVAAHGLRTPFWGPMSGLKSTIGGGISNLNAMFGAGHYGTSGESVIAMSVVLPDGRIIRTGARGPDGNTPFYRYFGPDLAGLFCGDTGTLGIKAEITLRLIRAPAHEDYASFSFKSGADLLNAMAEIARSGLACEMCAFDPGLTRIRMKRASLMGDVKALSSVVAKEKSLVKGLLSAAKIAVGGRNFVPEDEYPLHVVAEGRSAAGVAADMDAMRKISENFGGVEIENSIAKIIRATPFPPLNSVVGPDGEAWASVHGHVSLSNATRLFADIEALFAEMADDFEREGVTTAYLFTTLSTNALTVEPVFYWPQGWRAIHEAAAESDHLARLPRRDPNPVATALVVDARKRVAEICGRYGCAHFQIGRTYAYRERLDPASRRLLDTIKAELDPKGQLNPGGLGFPADGDAIR